MREEGQMIPTEAPDRLFGRIWDRYFLVIYQLICLLLFVNTMHRRESGQRTTRHNVKRFRVSRGFSSKTHGGHNSQCKEAERYKKVSITDLLSSIVCFNRGSCTASFTQEKP
jgi:hypothetical protein